MIVLKLVEWEVCYLCSLNHEPLRAWIETNVDKFVISNHMGLKLRIKTLRRYLKLACVHKLHVLPNTKVGVAKDHGENHMKL